MSVAMESIKEVVGEDFAYFKSWYDFNFNVEKYVPKEKLAAMCSGEAMAILLAHGHSRTAFRKKLLAALDLRTAVDYDIGAAAVRFVIAKREWLKRAAVVAGAIFHHKDVVRVISKKELGVLIEFIGKDIYDFVVKRGMILWKMVPEMRCTAKKSSIAEKVNEAGRQILANALFGIPDEVKKRLELIFQSALDIPQSCDEPIAKKCLELIKFSVVKISG
jgi:hypothetical protein